MAIDTCITNIFSEANSPSDSGTVSHPHYTGFLLYQSTVTDTLTGFGQFTSISKVPNVFKVTISGSFSLTLQVQVRRAATDDLPATAWVVQTSPSSFSGSVSNQTVTITGALNAVYEVRIGVDSYVSGSVDVTIINDGSGTGLSISVSDVTQGGALMLS